MDREIDYEEAYCLLTREPDGFAPTVVMRPSLRLEYVDLSDGRRLIRHHHVGGSRIFVREPVLADVPDHTPPATGEITDDFAWRLLTGEGARLFGFVEHNEHCHSVELSDGRRLVRQGDGAGGHRWILHEAASTLSGAELARALEEERGDIQSSGFLGRYIPWTAANYAAAAENMGYVVRQFFEMIGNQNKVFAVYPGERVLQDAPGGRPLLLIFGDYTTSRPHAWLAPVLEKDDDV